MRKQIIDRVAEFNACALLIWCLLMPASKQLTIFELMGVDYDLSRIIGLWLVCINTLLVPVLPWRKVPRLVLFAGFMFLLHAFAHIFSGSGPIPSLNMFIRIYGGFILFFVFMMSRNDPSQNALSRVILILGIVNSIYIVIQYGLYNVNTDIAFNLFGPSGYLQSYNTIRPRGLLQSAGGSGAVMALAVSVLLKRQIEGGAGRRDLLLGGILCVGLLLKFTRTYVFVLPVLLFANIAYYKGFSRTIIITSSLAGVIVISTVIVGIDHYSDRFRDIPMFSDETVKRRTAFMGRLVLADLIIEEYQELDMVNKVIGTDLYWTNRALSRHFGVEASTHNDFIWLMCNLGYIGLAFYAMFIWSLVKSYKFQHRFFYISYVLLIVVLPGMGGETIPVTGHRFFQMAFLGSLFAKGAIDAGR